MNTHHMVIHPRAVHYTADLSLCLLCMLYYGGDNTGKSCVVCAYMERLLVNTSIFLIVCVQASGAVKLSTPVSLRKVRIVDPTLVGVFSR